MAGERRRTAAALLCAAAALFASPGATARPAPMRVCERLVLSPSYATDGTAFCAGIDLAGDVDRLRVYVTRDRARSWTEAGPAVALTGTGLLGEFAVSPAFANDRMVVAQVTGATYVSTDAGASFTHVPVLTGRLTLDLAPGGDVVGATAHGVVLGAGGMPGGRASYVFDPVVPGLRVVPGSGTGRDAAFVVRPGAGAERAAFVVAVEGDTPATTRQTLYACDATWACPTKMGSLPATQRFDRAWFASDYARSGTLFVTTVDLNRRARLFVSRDRGRTLTVVPAIDAALRQGFATGNIPMVVVTPGRAGTSTVFARVSVGTDRRDPPAERLFRSDDNGRTWRLRAYGRSPYAPGHRGSMPYSYTYAAGSAESTPPGLLTYAPDGRLLMAGPLGTAATVWCSADLGRSWRAAC